ncbi:MAG: MBL fold metallo-hydrolase [Acidimicrobiales bacterium]|jgi:ribonuclease BN (tRNA processing enzyme)
MTPKPKRAATAPVVVHADDGFTLTVLGCDGSWPGPAGAGSGYLVRIGGTVLVVDAGPGTFAVLQTLLDPAEVDAVIVTHHHADHWTDLYAMDTQARFGRRRSPLPVYAPSRVVELAGPDRTPMLEWHPVTGGDRAGIGEASCAFHRTAHVEETLAVRIDGAGRALGYSADSGPAWSLDGLGSGLDLVLCEATYTSEFEGTADHMSGSQAGAGARAAAAKRLVITHRWPTIDADAVAKEAEAAFGGPVEQAAIGREFTL